MLTALTIAPDHPAYAGHFPGAPVLPGVVLLDAALHAIERGELGDARRDQVLQHWRVTSAKFQSAVRPGESLSLEYETLTNGSIRFAIRTADRAVASGVVVRAGTSHGEQG